MHCSSNAQYEVRFSILASTVNDDDKGCSRPSFQQGLAQRLHDSTRYTFPHQLLSHSSLVSSLTRHTMYVQKKWPKTFEAAVTDRDATKTLPTVQD